MTLNNSTHHKFGLGSYNNDSDLLTFRWTVNTKLAGDKGALHLNAELR
jgi:hypothetical protein